MGISEYVRICTGQMRCKRMRPVVEEEMLAHMEDQMEGYLSQGMDKAEAEALAVRQMGDPVEAGNELDRVHRPRMDWRAAGLILGLSLIGLIFQCVLAGDKETLLAYVWSTCVGVLLMFAVCFADYTLLGRYPRLIWCVMLALAVVTGMMTARINGMVRMRWSVMLLVPAFAGIVYHYRTERYRGLFKCVGWLLLGMFVVLKFDRGMMSWLLLPAGGIFLLGYAVVKGWYEIPKRAAAVIFAMPVLTGAALAAAAYLAGGYQAARIKAFFHPYSDAYGAGYIYVQVKESLRGLSLFGQAEKVGQLPAGGEESYVLLHIAERYGLFAAACLLAVFCLLFAELLRKNRRQNNRLGALTAGACIVCLLVPAGIHVLLNTGIAPLIDCSLPFISMKGKEGVSLYLLMGLLLSVYRSGSTAPEPAEMPAVWRRRKETADL